MLKEQGFVNLVALDQNFKLIYFNRVIAQQEKVGITALKEYINVVGGAFLSELGNQLGFSCFPEIPNFEGRFKEIQEFGPELVAVAKEATGEWIDRCPACGEWNRIEVNFREEVPLEELGLSPAPIYTSHP